MHMTTILAQTLIGLFHVLKCLYCYLFLYFQAVSISGMATGLPCFKVILYGDYGVGKSSIFRRFLDNSFTSETGPRSTIGLDHFKKEFVVGEKKFLVSVFVFVKYVCNLFSVLHTHDVWVSVRA